MSGFDLNRWSPRYLLIEDIMRGGELGRVRGVTVIEAAMRGRGYSMTGVFGWNTLWASHQTEKERLEKEPGYWVRR